MTAEEKRQISEEVLVMTMAQDMRKGAAAAVGQRPVGGRTVTFCSGKRVEIIDKMVYNNTIKLL